MALPALGTVVRYTLAGGQRSGTWESRRMGSTAPGGLGRPATALGGRRSTAAGLTRLTQAGEGRTLLVSRYRPELSGAQVLLKPYLKRWLRRERLASAQALKALVEADAPS